MSTPNQPAKPDYFEIGKEMVAENMQAAGIPDELIGAALVAPTSAEVFVAMMHDGATLIIEPDSITLRYPDRTDDPWETS